MKLRTSFLTRFLALALALVMIASSANLGLVARVFAATGSGITDGELVANNYGELSDAEKDLLESNLLVGGNHEYKVPAADDAEDLITVDPDNKTIEAKNYEDGHGNTWLPVAAKVVAPDAEENVTLTDGNGSFEYGGIAYTVEVAYQTSIGVDTAVHTTLLNTAGWLKNGIASIDKVAAVAGSLTVLEEALPPLVDMAKNGYTTAWGPASFTDAVKASIFALDAQMTANNGKLNLSVMVSEYNSGKVKYLLNNGAAMLTEIGVSAGHFEEIYTPMKTIVDFAAMNPGLVDETQLGQISLATETLDILKTATRNAEAGDWTAAEKGTALVKAGITDAEYAILDTLVAALGATHSAEDFTIAQNIAIDTVTLTVNTSMVNVTLTAQVNFYENGVENIEIKSGVVTLPEGTPKADVVSNADVYDGQLRDLAEELGLDLGAHFEVSFDTSITGELLEAGEQYYTITYSPKKYTVSYDYQESEEVAYGAKILLPKNETAGKVYDYFVDGEYVAQGSYVTITGKTEITRTEGKSYTYENLYEIIADNYAPNGDKVAAILKSGALNGDSVIAVRYPDADNGALVTLEDGVLTAKTYASGYAGLIWTPYSYTFNDGEVGYFNGATSVTISKSSYDNISVVYRLTLTNISAATVEEKLALAKALIDEGEGQISTLNALTTPDVIGNMKQLDYTKFSGLNGVISATRFVDTNGDGKVDTNDSRTDPANIEMQNYFAGIVSGIMANNLDSNDMLKLYNMLDIYVDEQNGGLSYYYHNSAAVIDEIDSLGTYLNDLLADEEKKAALTIMVNAAGFSGYDDKIANLGNTMERVKNDLTHPNKAINLESANLDKLIAALNMTGSIETEAAGHPYLTSDAFVVTAPNKVNIKVNVQVEGGKPVTYPATFVKGHDLTASDIATIKNEVAKNIEALNIDTGLYTNDYANGAALDALVGTELNENVTLTYTWKMKNFSVAVEGVDGETKVNLDSSTVELPAAPEGSGLRYEYVVNGKQVASGKYTFTAEELKTLFADGKLTITRVVIDEGAEKLDAYVAALNTAAGGTIDNPVVVLKDGVITANVDMDGMMGIVMAMAESTYAYIGLDGQGFKYVNEKQATEISMQTLIDAFLNDESFGSNTIVNMNGASAEKPAQLISTTKQLGSNANNAQSVGFVINLTSAPEGIASVADLLNTGYVSFKTDNGALTIELNLPEKLYQVYLTALIITGEVDMTDEKKVNDTIALNFMWDYVNGIITNEEITTETYTNTLNKLGQGADLTGYQDTYEKLCAAIEKYFTVENGKAYFQFVDDSGLLKGLLDKMMAGKETLLGMIKEYELDEGETGLTITATISVNGIISDYEALIVDNGDSGINKFDYTTSLDAETINGTAVIILLDDVTVDELVIPATAILDLNGFVLTGDIDATGNLIIIDSDLDTFEGGAVIGNVSGNVTIMGGKYTADGENVFDVSNYLKHGYKQNDNGTVYNTLYTVDADGTNITYSINANVVNDTEGDYIMPSVDALAIDIAADLILNHYTTAYLELDGNKIYGVALDDLVEIISGNGTDALIVDLLNTIDAPGISAFVNKIIEDLLDFETISANIGTKPISTYTMVTNPWKVNITHVDPKGENYLTVGIGYGDTSKDYVVNIQIVGENAATEEVKDLTGALAEIVTKTDITVNLEQPTYTADNKLFDITGTAKAVVEIDLTKNENYTTILAVILANGTGKTSYVDAINTGDLAALKKAVDATTITEVFTSLKKLSRNVSFATMAANNNVTIDVEDAAALEAAYHVALTAVGAILEEFDVSGGSRTLGSFDTDNDGVYVADKDNPVIRAGETTVSSYNVGYDLTLTDLSLTVKVFGEIKDEPEETYAIYVTDAEGNPVLGEAGAKGFNTFDAAWKVMAEGYTMTINPEMTSPVTVAFATNVNFSFTIKNAHLIDMGSNYFDIANTEVKITADSDSLNLASSKDGYKVDYADGVYQLAEFSAYGAQPVVAVSGTIIEEIRYLLLELPIDGRTAAELQPGIKIEGMDDASITIEIEGYTDGSLVKTDDIMKISIVEGKKTVAFITYTVIVLGDTNSNGKIDVGDAVAMKNLYINDLAGKETEGVTYGERLAANANMNQGVDVGDAVRIKNKWILMSEADDKEAAWLEWIEKITPVVE